MAITIVLTNQKGGVGKTTTSCALAMGLKAHGYNVLAIDMDPQGNLAFSLGGEIDDTKTLYDLLNGNAKVSDVVQNIDGCDIIPSNILLSQAEITFKGKGRDSLLKNALADVQDDYDFIVIDTPPALNILTLNGYVAADHLIIPMASEILSLVGLVQLRETVDAVKESVNPNLNVLGILLTRYNERTKLAKDVLEMAEVIADQTGSKVFNSKIRTGVAAAEAPAHGLSVIDYAPKSNPGKDYNQFVVEVLNSIFRYHVTGKR